MNYQDKTLKIIPLYRIGFTLKILVLPSQSERNIEQITE